MTQQRTLICSYFHLTTIILASSLIIGTVVATTVNNTTTSTTITTTKTDINKSKTDQELMTIGNYIDDEQSTAATEPIPTTSIISVWPFTLMAKYFGYDDDRKNNSNGESEGITSRTFGRIKKLQMSLLPIMFKLGVMATIIFLILFLTAKSVLIGLTLLVINLGFIIAKLVALKIDHGHGGGGGGGWVPSSHGHANDVHVHIHNSGPSYEKQHYHEPYGAYSHHSEASSAPGGIYIDGNGSGGSPWSTRGYGNNRRQNRILYPTVADNKYDWSKQQRI